MSGKTVCDACNSADLHRLYALDRIPVFLNKLFPTREAARRSPVARIDLMECGRCGLVFNAEFQDALMDYDELYMQSQGHSPSFRDYTDAVLNLFVQDLDLAKDRVVEIGCGKEAYFLNILLDRGVDIVGFDPLYAGADPRVTKANFSQETAQGLKANVAILRLTLYLLERPLDFLRNLKAILPRNTTIYIETPRFEWIVDNDAFWDVSHEICNYFTEDFFQRIFAGKADIHRTFSDQYMIVKGRLDDLTARFAADQIPAHREAGFQSSIPAYRNALRQHGRNLVWGAGAKGSAFANILDPDAALIDAVVDINRDKQGRFLPLESGHPCVAPDEVRWRALGEDACLWIMNGNYKAEILGLIPGYTKGQVFVLGESRLPAEAA